MIGNKFVTDLFYCLRSKIFLRIEAVNRSGTYTLSSERLDKK